MLVDADADSRDIYRESLNWAGFRVTALADAVTALSSVRRARPDLIVTALRLPGLDGFDMSALLHSDPRTAGIPLIALSTSVSDHERALHEGRFAAVLMKPCLPATLARRAARALGTDARAVAVAGQLA